MDELFEPTIYTDGGPCAEHNMPCAVYCNEHAVLELETAIFLPSWKAQAEGWMLIKVPGWLQKLLRHVLTWIDNLTTGSGRNLASPSHKNHYMPYVQEYLREIGERKCEANAIVVLPRIARQLVQGVIESYLGPDAEDRFEDKRRAVREELDEFMETSGVGELLTQIFDAIENREE